MSIVLAAYYVPLALLLARDPLTRGLLAEAAERGGRALLRASTSVALCAAEWATVATVHAACTVARRVGRQRAFSPSPRGEMRACAARDSSAAAEG